MSKERIYLTVTGAICVLGCAFLLFFNYFEADYGGATVIPRSEYNRGTAVTGENTASGDSSDVHPDSMININKATASELADGLPGIGKKKAESIVEYRESAGGFNSVDELINVEGIGKYTLENIRPYCKIRD